MDRFSADVVHAEFFRAAAPADNRWRGRDLLATGDGRVGFIDAEDIAAVAAVALTAPDIQSGEPILNWPETLSYDQVAFAPATLSPILDRLENRGFVRRTSPAEDKRQKLVVITKQGRAFALTCRVELKAVADRYFTRIDAVSISHANIVVMALRKNLKNPPAIDV